MSGLDSDSRRSPTCELSLQSFAQLCHHAVVSARHIAKSEQDVALDGCTVGEAEGLTDGVEPACRKFPCHADVDENIVEDRVKALDGDAELLGAVLRELRDHEEEVACVFVYWLLTDRCPLRMLLVLSTCCHLLRGEAYRLGLELL